MVRLFKGALLVLVELILHTQVVLHEETPVDDLPCFDLDGSPRAVAHTVSAVAAKLRFVLCRLFIKGGLMFRGSEIVFRAAVFRLELRIAFDRPLDPAGS